MDGWEAAWRVEWEMIGKLVQYAVTQIVAAHIGKVEFADHEYFRTLATEAEE